MKKVKLSEICDIVIGRTPSRSINEYWGKGKSWVSISDIKHKYISETKEQITDFAISDARCRLVKKGTLLFSFKLTIGKVAFADKDLYTNEAIAALPIKDISKINSEYLYYALKSVKYGGSNQAVMGKTLNSKSLAEIKIPVLEKLEDQIRIANILSKAEALIAKRKESIQLLDELLKSTFLDMFGDPVRNEKGWEVFLLGDLTNLITDGKHGNCIDDEDSGYYFISAKDINNGVINYSKARQILQEEFEEVHKRTDLMPNDVVVVNTGATIGKTAIVRDDPKTRKTTFQKSVAIIKVKPEKLNPVYLKHLFFLRIKNLSSNSYGSAVKNMLLSEMRKFIIPLPSLTKQNQFAQIVEKVESMKTKYRESLQELEKLYASLSQKAFKGELDLSKMEVKDYNLGHAEPGRSMAAEEGVGYGNKESSKK